MKKFFMKSLTEMNTNRHLVKLVMISFKALRFSTPIIAVVILGITEASMAFGHGPETGVFSFTPIAKSADKANWNPAAPWLIPEGFRQSVVADEQSLNIYKNGVNDRTDMNTVNETGDDAGRFLYRTHEVRGGKPWTRFLRCPTCSGGSVSVVDLNTGIASILVQNPGYQALDGLRWTPWGSILFGEETKAGRVFEIILDKDDLTQGLAYERPAMGRLTHEGIAIDSDGSIYLVDERRGLTKKCPDGSLPCGGGIYRFVPKNPGDLSQGALYVLGVSGGAYNTGQGEWLGPIDPTNARQAGSKIGGASYQRPEDLEIIGNTLYVALTEGPPAPDKGEVFEGRVLAIDLSSMAVTNFLLPGVNAPLEKGMPGGKGFQTGMDSVDNLAVTPDGLLMIIEDNSPSDIWVADKDHDGDGMADDVWLFASLRDPKGEGSGIYFGKDPLTLFVNIQHSAKPDGDGTWAITKE